MVWTTGVRFPTTEMMFYSVRFQTGSGLIQSPINWVPMALSPEMERPGREADYSPPSNGDVNDAWSYISTPQIRLHGVVLS